MSYWIEIHCDERSNVEDPAAPYGRRLCFSHSNDNPSAKSRKLEAGAKLARTRAREGGWRQRQVGGRMGWVCPHCQRFPDPNQGEVPF